MQDGGCRDDEGCAPGWGGAEYPGADFPWLAANVVDTSTGETVLPGTTVEEINGVKVGYIGMTLEDTPSLVAQSGIQGIEFRDEVETANAAAAALKQQGVKTIIVLLHEGGFQTGTFNQCAGISGPIVAIAQNLDPEIDLVVTGHTHLPYNCMIPDPAGPPRMVTSASSFGRVVTETSLVINTRSGQVKREQVTSTNHLVPRVNPDPVQTAFIAKWGAFSDPIGLRPVGSVSANSLNVSCRCTEQAMGNVIADAQLASAAAGGAQIAPMNPGGVRASLTFAQTNGEGDGVVTYEEAFNVQPFSNVLTTMSLTGTQIHELLEQQAIATRGRPVLILGISDGFSFSYNAAGACGDRIDPATITLNGVVLDPAASYRIVTNNFLADGGDGFTVFRDGTNRSPAPVEDDLAALLDYPDRQSGAGPAARPHRRHLSRCIGRVAPREKCDLTGARSRLPGHSSQQTPVRATMRDSWSR